MEDAIDLNQLVNDFAFRCFFEMADGDYVAARMAYRTGLIPQFLWASQQALEKYLKYILLMRRIRAVKVKHDLDKAIERIESGGIQLNLTPVTKEFIQRLDQVGRYRYGEVSHVVLGNDLLRLDRAVWEVRRYCTPKTTSGLKQLQEGVRPPRVHVAGGYLEKVMGDRENPARKELLWQNGFFGRKRKHVRLPRGFTATNSPLFLNPHIVDEVMKYVLLPGKVEEAYRQLSLTRSSQPEPSLPDAVKAADPSPRD